MEEQAEQKKEKEAGKRKNKKQEILWKSPLVVAVLLILLLIAASVLAAGWVNRMEEERSFEELYEETNRLAQEIEDEMENDREELELLAAVIAEYEDLTSQELWKILDSYDMVGMMSRLELLLPDDTVLTEGGKRVDVSGLLSFEEEAEHGAHVSDRVQDLDEAGTYIVRNYVPVKRDGQIIAMLYGVVELGSLPEDLEAAPYGGQAAIYIIEGQTGDFLVDTWHSESGGNIWALGRREMAPGYDHDTLKRGLTEGDTGYVVFVSETTGQYLYFYFEPLEINEWRIALSVPEDVVFEIADSIRAALNVFLGFEIICFIAYFLWMLRYVRNVTSEKQRQLDTINYIYDVEKLLFNAHEDRKNIDLVLEKIAQITLAEKVGFWTVEDSTIGSAFFWCRNLAEKGQERDTEEAASLLRLFEAGRTQLEAYDEETMEAIFPDIPQELKAKLPNSMVAVPVKDMEGSICGILAVCNLSGGYLAPVFLKNVEFSFGMFCHNLRTYKEIKEKGEKDLMSGLYNRNRYEMDLEMYRELYTSSLACVYIDVNGLHEKNNSEGHEAGDKMLKTVAEQIREKFGGRHAYRIGGDEFLAFAADMEEEEVCRLGRAMSEALRKENIEISVGIQWEKEVSSLEELIKTAEKKMYKAKQKYYEKEEHDRRKRERR